MFDTPVRNVSTKDPVYVVPLKHPFEMNVRIELNTSGLVPTLQYMSEFETLRTTILQELTKHRQLFKSPPSFESLHTICPPWGFIQTSDGPALSPYTKVDILDTAPCYVKFVLKSITFSRSSLTPQFETKFVESLAVIDFDFSSGEEDEIQEVSDITTMDDEAVTIKNPALYRREKMEKKEKIKEELRTAHEALSVAQENALKFLHEYDMSDDESAFSEWLSDNED